MDEEKLATEIRIDAFLDIEGENLEGKPAKEILMAWEEWLDARYKVSYVPNVLYAIFDCNSGDNISIVHADVPNAKEKAREICASLNEGCSGEY